MNAKASEGGGSMPPSRDRRNKKKSIMEDPNLAAQAERRRTHLVQALEHHKETTGGGLTLTEISLKYGRSPSAANHYATGEQPLNVEWMLIFSLELWRAPQEIFKDDWPFQDLTVSPTFAQLFKKWNRLPPRQQALVLKMIHKASKQL